MSVIWSKILWQIITIDNCFSKGRSQSRVLDVVRSVTGAFNRSQFKLNRSLKIFSIAAWTISLSSSFQGWDCHRSFRWGLVAISEGVWSFFCKNDVGYPKSKSHSISLANDFDHPKSKITFQQKVFGFFLANDFNHQKSKITFQGKHRGCKGTAQALPGLQVTLCIPDICQFFLHRQNFWRIKFTQKNANFAHEICKKTPLFCVKSVEKANFSR